MEKLDIVEKEAGVVIVAQQDRILDKTLKIKLTATLDKTAKTY